jgi:hypothetical protein
VYSIFGRKIGGKFFEHFCGFTFLGENFEQLWSGGLEVIFLLNYLVGFEFFEF